MTGITCPTNCGTSRKRALAAPSNRQAQMPLRQISTSAGRAIMPAAPGHTPKITATATQIQTLWPRMMRCRHTTRYTKTLKGTEI